MMGRPKKLSSEQIEEMRAARTSGESLRALAARFGVSEATAQNYTGSRLKQLRARVAELEKENEALRATLEAVGVA